MTGNRKEFFSSYSRKSSHARMSNFHWPLLMSRINLASKLFSQFYQKNLQETDIRNEANSAKISKVKGIFTFAKYRKNSKISKFDKILDLERGKAKKRFEKQIPQKSQVTSISFSLCWLNINLMPQLKFDFGYFLDLSQTWCPSAHTSSIWRPNRFSHALYFRLVYCGA